MYVFFVVFSGKVRTHQVKIDCSWRCLRRVTPGCTIVRSVQSLFVIESRVLTYHLIKVFKCQRILLLVIGLYRFISFQTHIINWFVSFQAFFIFYLSFSTVFGHHAKTPKDTRSGWKIRCPNHLNLLPQVQPKGNA